MSNTKRLDLRFATLLAGSIAVMVTTEVEPSAIGLFGIVTTFVVGHTIVSPVPANFACTTASVFTGRDRSAPIAVILKLNDDVATVVNPLWLLVAEAVGTEANCMSAILPKKCLVGP